MPATAVVNPQGQPQPESTTGKVQDNGAEIGSQNNKGYIPQKQPTEAQTNTQPVAPVPETQPQNKDERHAARKITELSEKSINFARLAIEANGEAIYQIAEADPALAEKMLKEFDYGTESLEELLAKKANPEASPKEVERDTRIQELEKRVLDETVKRLKKDHPDLKDGLEEEFRSMYSNPTFEKYDEDQKLNIARAATGISSQGPSNDTLLEMLKQQEGSMSPAKGIMPIEKRPSKIPPQSAQFYKSAGVTEEKLEKYLPPDIDEQIERMYARLPTGG